MSPTRWQKVVLIPAMAGIWLLAGCSKSASPTSSGTTPATAPASSSSIAEQQDLAQAQQDIADLEQSLAQVDAGLNANPQTEGDVSP
ncbi:MAG: hypothetical protein QOD01_119 [Actinomycetota bacterium]|nr:hypothetical protein [Actinomycetota bacterium]